ncbi:MAG: DUF368 domain-containing protein [Chlamydiae bacterium CG10_big_fil_rev_8_21_14_0_10_35_9]|nr:MAG: DUF368 domain-containing protein [Chlamydiae bacterium CG10_big_fil_rev_8_21_14_0_10_35_9]
MGIADLLPGISGGTVAFLTNIYERWLSAIKSIQPRYLLKLQFRTFIKKINWRFLFPLLAGIIVAIFLFSQIIHFILEHSTYKKYFIYFFASLIFISIISIARTIPKKNPINWVFFLCGAAISYLIYQGLISYPMQSNYFYLFLAGLLGVFAMLLPGISGSSVLVLLGLYQTIIFHVKNFFDSIVRQTLPLQSMLFLGSFTLGILLGLMVFSRLVLYLYKNYQHATNSLLLGLMLGSINGLFLL